MTEAEAQEWMTKTMLVWTDDQGTQWIGFKDVDKCVYAPDDRGGRYLSDSEFDEELTLQQIVDLAGG